MRWRLAILLVLSGCSGTPAKVTLPLSAPAHINCPPEGSEPQKPPPVRTPKRLKAYADALENALDALRIKYNVCALSAREVEESHH
jgi:hypothetical protein